MSEKDPTDTNAEAANQESKTRPTDEGLHEKYDVKKDGEPISDCFVLRPETDEAAQAALKAYADHTSNEELSEDLTGWVEQIGEADTNSA